MNSRHPATSTEREYDEWQQLVRALEETGVVTQDDSQSPMSANQTPGQRVYRQIRSWGRARVAAAVATVSNTRS